MLLNLPLIIVLLVVTKCIPAYLLNGFEKLHSRSLRKSMFYSSNTLDEELLKNSEYNGNKKPMDETFVKVPNEYNDFAKGELTIFVLDMSMPGVEQRIRSIKSAVTSIQPRGKVAVVGCLYGAAHIYLQPTSSIISATRSLKVLRKSVMGNISKGMHHGIDIAEKSLLAGECDHVSIAILADGRAHGLRGGPSTCDDYTPICDLELLEEAEIMARRRDHLLQTGYKLHVTVVDTEILGENLEWSPEGARLAASSHASYYHTPKLNGKKLLSILNDVKFNNNNLKTV